MRLIASLGVCLALRGAALTPLPPLVVPIAFEENLGQSPRASRFVVAHANIGLSCTAVANLVLSRSAVNLTLAGADSGCAASLATEDGTVSRYYRGGPLVVEARRYQTARFEQVWPGVNVTYQGSGQSLIAVFHLAQASRLANVRLQLPESTYYSALEVSAKQDQDLTVTKTVDGGVLMFAVDGAAPGQPLLLRVSIPIQMPSLAIGVNALDREGNRYFGADTSAYSNLDPLSANCVPASPFPNASSKCSDVSVAAFDPKGKLRYFVYLLGSRIDSLSRLAVDPNGNVFLLGSTYSKDFFTTVGAYQTTYAGPEEMAPTGRYTYPGGDVFVVKLDGPSGGLIWSTLIGTEGRDVAGWITADGSGRATVSVGGDSPSRVVGLDEMGASARFSIGADPASVAGLSDGGLALLTYVSQRQQFSRLDSNGLPLFSIISESGAEWFTSIAAGPNGSVYLTRGRTLLRADVDGAVSVIASNVPLTHGIVSDDVGGVWVQSDRPESGLTGNAPLRQCPASFCSWLLHFDPTGELTLATYLPPGNFSMEAGGGRLYLWSSFGESFTLTDGPPNTTLATVVDLLGSTAEFVPGNLVTLNGWLLVPSLGSDEEILYPLDSSGRAATNVNGVRVLLAGEACVILRASRHQMAVLLPLDFPANGQVPFSIEQDGEVVATMAVRLAPGAPKVIWGNNALPGMDFRNEDGTVNSATNPARVSSTVSFYVISVGKTNPPAVAGEMRHAALAQPVDKLGVEFVLQGPIHPMVSLQQAPEFVSGIYEAKVQLVDLPSFTYAITLLLTRAGAIVSGTVPAPQLFVTR